MAALNDKQSKELCRKIEQHILRDGYFIFDTDDWDDLHIEYKQFTHGKDYEYADYTEITVTFDDYNVTDKLQVKYNFIKSVYVGRTGDSYRVYYKRENGEKDGGRQYSMDGASEFIANRFIGLVEDKIMDKKLEARIAKLEGILLNKVVKNEAASSYDSYSINDKVCAHNPADLDYKYKAVIVDIGKADDLKKKYQDMEDFIYNWYLEDGNVSKMTCVVKIVDDEFEDYDEFDYDKNVLYLWPIECIAPDYSDVNRTVNNYLSEAVDKLEKAIKFVKSLTKTENNRGHYRRLIKTLEYVIDSMNDALV